LWKSDDILSYFERYLLRLEESLLESENSFSVCEENLEGPNILSYLVARSWAFLFSSGKRKSSLHSDV